jgi:hypothetical protein
VRNGHLKLAKTDVIVEVLSSLNDVFFAGVHVLSI